VASDFFNRMELAKRLVGGGKLYGYANVDQVYARYQDGFGDVDDGGDAYGTGVITPTQMSKWPSGRQERWGGAPDVLGIDFRHPQGGHAMYLTGTLTAIGPKWTADLCGIFPSGGAYGASDVFRNNLDNLKAAVRMDAPRMYGFLMNSTNLKVWGEGGVFYERPAEMPRLPEAVLAAMSSARDDFYLRYMTQVRKPNTKLSYYWKRGINR
jgi:hypothetical protein